MVKMERLRQLFEETGFTGVSTHIASGNVLFTAGRGRPATFETKIETALGLALGWGGATFRNLTTVRAMAARLSA